MPPSGFPPARNTNRAKLLRQSHLRPLQRRQLIASRMIGIGRAASCLLEDVPNRNCVDDGEENKRREDAANVDHREICDTR